MRPEAGRSEGSVWKKERARARRREQDGQRGVLGAAGWPSSSETQGRWGLGHAATVSPEVKINAGIRMPLKTTRSGS